MKHLKLVGLLLMFMCIFSVNAQKLSAVEKRILSQVENNNDEAISLLEKVVNINSGTLNLEGVNYYE